MLTACNTGTVDPDDVDLGYDYFPIEIGQEREYHVKRTDFVQGDKTTREYFVKEVVEDTIQDFEELSYQLYRYYRDSLSQPWTLDSIWTTKITPAQAIRSENNIRKVVLTFPIDKDKEWDRNSQNDKGYELGAYDEIDKVFSYDSASYENTVTVLVGPNDPPNLIETDQRSEVYAENVGLVYVSKNVISYNVGGGDTSGVQLVQKLIRFEK